MTTPTVLTPPVAPGDASDPAQLARAAAYRPAAAERASLLRSVEGLAVPSSDVLYSPYSVRLAAWGITEGLAAVHHELRCAPPLSAEQLPEVEVWDGERPHPVWRDGVLVVPKYFSGFLDAPLPTFDPNLRGKWRPHEILHRLVGFFWRPDLTRFEFYLGARLGELLPVVHWYGLDEIGRRRCARHLGETPGRGHCSECEALLGPYWDHDPVPEAFALRHAEHALEHFGREIDACARELETGRRHPTPRPGLDASSDAVGYVRGHWNRVTAWSFGAWVERFARSGHDVFGSLAEFLPHVRDLFDHLRAGPIVLDPLAGASAEARRFVSDLAYRTLCLMELFDEDAVEDALMPWIDEAAERAVTPESARELAAALLERLQAAVGVEDAQAVMGTGHRWSPRAASVRQVSVGLRSALPRSLAQVSDDELNGWADRFVADPAFVQRGELAVRFARHVAGPDDGQTGPIQLESWLLASPRLDLEAERFAVVPEELAEGRLRLNSTIRFGTFAAADIEVVLDDLDLDGALQADLMAIHFGGEPRVVLVDPPIVAVVREAEQGRWSQDDDTTFALLDSGFLVFFPAPR